MGERKYLVTAEELAKAIEEAETIGIPFSQKGAANGVGTLDATGRQPESQSPLSVVSSSRTTTIFAANLPLPVLPTNSAVANGEAIKALEELLTAGGNCTVVFPGGKVATNRSLVVKSANVTLRMWGCTLEPTTAVTEAVIKFTAPNGRVGGLTCPGGSATTVGVQGTSAATGLVVRLCTLSGFVSTTGAQPQGAAVYVAGDDSLVEGNAITGCMPAGSSYYQQAGGIIAAGVTGTSGRRITIRTNHCSGNGNHGIYASGCDNINITENYCYENGALATTNSEYGRGISIGTAAAISPKITVNTLYLNQENGLIVSGGSQGADSSLATDAIVSCNTAYLNNQGNFPGGHGLEVNSVGATVTGNVCYENHNGISISGIMQTITGNRCYLNKSTTAEQGNGIQTYFVATEVTVALCQLTATSPTVTVAAGGFPNVKINQKVTGTGVPAETFVVAISGNTLTLSANVEAGKTGEVTLTFKGVQQDNTIAAKICENNDNNGIKVFGTGAAGSYAGPTVANNHCFFNGVKNNANANYDLFVDNRAKGGIYVDNVTKNISYRISISDSEATIRRGNTSSSDTGLTKSLTFGSNVSLVGEAWEMALLPVSETKAFTVKVPEVASRFNGREITLMIYNSSGSAMGTITWEKEGESGGYSLAGAFTNPANNKRRMITFRWFGERWYEVSRTAADQ